MFRARGVSWGACHIKTKEKAGILREKSQGPRETGVLKAGGQAESKGDITAATVLIRHNLREGSMAHRFRGVQSLLHRRGKRSM